MPMDFRVLASDVSDKYDAIIDGGNPSGFPSDFAVAYLDDVMRGAIPVAINTGAPAVIISDVLESVTSDPSSVGILADAFVDFWSLIGLVPMPPFVSVVSDAAGKRAAFEAAILASITTTEAVPHFERFFENIENVVKSIIWTATDPSGGTVTGGII